MNSQNNQQLLTPHPLNIPSSMPLLLPKPMQDSSGYLFHQNYRPNANSSNQNVDSNIDNFIENNMSNIQSRDSLNIMNPGFFNPDQALYSINRSATSNDILIPFTPIPNDPLPMITPAFPTPNFNTHSMDFIHQNINGHNSNDHVNSNSGMKSSINGSKIDINDCYPNNKDNNHSVIDVSVDDILNWLREPI